MANVRICTAYHTNRVRMVRFETSRGRVCVYTRMRGLSDVQCPRGNGREGEGGAGRRSECRKPEPSSLPAPAGNFQQLLD
eukprot:9480058-Pyramimonas_sp.AAC.2